MDLIWPLDVILSHLGRKHGGNVHNKGIVTITASSVLSGDAQHSPKNVFDPGTLGILYYVQDLMETRNKILLKFRLPLFQCEAE
jgi:hypothetical protein